MHKKLILSAFKKGEEERKKSGDNSPAPTNIAKTISDFLSNDFGMGLTERRLMQFYNKANQLRASREDINISKIKVVEGLCHYVGHTSYEEFVKSISSPAEKLVCYLRKNQNTLIICVFTIAITFVVSLTGRKRWMIWDETKFVEVTFDKELLERGELKVFNANQIKNFKRIKKPNCRTPYFNSRGEPITWYYKVKKGHLEVYSAPGLHPKNGKTLKPITAYMIKEHICPEYKI